MFSYVTLVVLCAGAVTIGLAVAGAVLVYRGFVLRSQGGRSQEWPSTRGVVEESTVRSLTTTGPGGEEAREHLPYVRYRYTVGNQSYTASHLSPGMLNTGRTAEQARQLTDRYPVGSSVRVWYNPQDHGEAILEQHSSGAAGGLAAGIVLLAISALTVFLFFGLSIFAIIAMALR